MHFENGDIEEASFDLHSFDFILCSSALIYLSDVEGALTEWHHWLKPGGKLVFNTPKVSSVTLS